MNGNHFSLYIVLCILVLILAGCSLKNTTYPEQLAEVTEVFVDEKKLPPEPAYSQYIHKSAFDEVFDSTLYALQKLDYMPILYDRDVGSGTIIGEQTVTNSSGRKYRLFTRILIGEDNPGSTIVQVQAKEQAECNASDTGIGWHIASLGLIKAIEVATDASDYKERCINYISQPHWLDGNLSSPELLEHIQQMIAAMVLAGSNSAREEIVNNK